MIGAVWLEEVQCWTISSSEGVMKRSRGDEELID